jgi:hypothetical protein
MLNIILTTSALCAGDGTSIMPYHYSAVDILLASEYSSTIIDREVNSGELPFV